MTALTDRRSPAADLMAAESDARRRVELDEIARECEQHRDYCEQQELLRSRDVLVLVNAGWGWAMPPVVAAIEAWQAAAAATSAAHAERLEALHRAAVAS